MDTLEPDFDPFQRARTLEHLPPATHLGGFEVLERLGAGGFARVFRARDPSGRDVALKILERRTPTQLERFRREATATAALDHPHVLRIHSAGATDQQPYLVTELVPGCQTLDVALADLGRDAGLDLILQAARGLAHAHTRGIAHRDVKPHNLLVGSDGRLRVADFGLALRDDDDRLTHTGAPHGTPGYLAPEQALGRVAAAHAARCDVWALGVFLYRFLTRSHPFPHSGPLGCPLSPDVPLVPPRQLDPTISPALQRVCLRALAWDPLARYPDAAAFTSALESARLPTTRARLALFALLPALVVGLAALSSPSAPPLPPAAPATHTPTPLRSPAGLDLPLSSDLPARLQGLLDWGAPNAALQLLADVSPTPEVELLRARVLLELSRFADAHAALDRAATDDPTARVLAIEAHTLLRSGRLRPSLARLRAALVLEPSLDDFLQLVRPFTDRGVPFDLAPHFALARDRLGPSPALEAAWALHLAKLGEAAAADAVLAGLSPDLRLLRAQVCFEGGRFRRALTLLEDAEGWREVSLRAEAHARAGDLEAAEVDLARLERVDGPPSWRLAALRGRVELARGRLGSAEDALARGLQTCPGRPELELLRAEVWIAQGRTDAAVEVLARFDEAEAPTVGQSLVLQAEVWVERGDRLGATLRVESARTVLALRDARLWERLEALERSLETGR